MPMESIYENKSILENHFRMSMNSYDKISKLMSKTENWNA